MINGPSLFNLRTALPTANPGTAGSPGFSRVLSETDAPLPAQPGAGAPQRPGLDAPRSQEAPKSAKPTEPPPAHNPGGRMEQPPTAARPITAQRPATRTAAAPQEQKASPASDASNAPAPLTSTTGQPNDESALAEAASADTPPSLQALLAALQPSNDLHLRWPGAHWPLCDTTYVHQAMDRPTWIARRVRLFWNCRPTPV
jgi:hypothetical protein